MRDKNWSFGEELKESPDLRKNVASFILCPVHSILYPALHRSNITFNSAFFRFLQVSSSIFR